MKTDEVLDNSILESRLGGTARRSTRRVVCGGVPIGGGVPVSIQSMTNTDTRDISATVGQIVALAEAGCDIVRCAVPDEAAVEAARRNFASNRVKLDRSWVGSANGATEKYDFVVANIVADVLIAIKTDLQNALTPSGVLIVSGILERLINRITVSFGDMNTLLTIKNGEWLTLALKLKEDNEH
jgi:ribosomal protein L11 methyltransferase